ncbi:MAG: hypothetical protein ACOYNO_04295 [Saprospiraceae bacterium]
MIQKPIDLIADCGSTKCDWLLLSDPPSHLSSTDYQLVRTAGFSPFFHATTEIVQILEQQLRPALGKDALVGNIWFYGTGIHDAHRAGIVEDAFLTVFPNAVVSVKHDLLAAARATCGFEPGIACILGTGSNSCLYDGQDIIDNVPSLGWLLGDEGSGTHLGKTFLRAWYYRELPQDLKDLFEHAHPEGPHYIKDRIYEKGGNAYLATFSRFMVQHHDHPVIQQMVHHCLQAFVSAHLTKYEGHQRLPVHFVGSIAHHYQDILTVCLQENGLSLGKIIQKPIQALVAFHLPQHTNTKQG